MLVMGRCACEHWEPLSIPLSGGEHNDLYTVPLSKSASLGWPKMGKPSIQGPPLSKKSSLNNS